MGAPHARRRPQVRPGALSTPLEASPLVVRVLPDVPAIDKTFDYLVPEPLRDQVRVGDVVRVELHGRRVGAWVVAVGVEPPPGVVLRPLAKRSGRGPGADLQELARWAAHRWAGRPASFLKPASPPRVVPALPASADAPPRPSTASREVRRLPPGEDPVSVLDEVVARGPALVVCPSIPLARRAWRHLRDLGVPVAGYPRDWAAGAAGASVVGTRSAAWAPVAGLAGVVVLDEHDEGHQQEQAPTWNARDVAVERAARAGVPCLLTSPTPSLEALDWGELVVPGRTRERTGWPPVEVVDRRDEDPRRAGLWSPAVVQLVRSPRQVLCVLNRTGRAKLLTCAACGHLARCETCDAAVARPDDALVCPRCATVRPPVCLACGAGRFKHGRLGVARAREELEALVGEPVAEVTAATDDLALTRVAMGTEALLHRVEAADAVVFVDLDQELFAPRYRAAEQALGLVARAARVARRGRVVLQTRAPDHEVVRAAVGADPDLVADAERARRRLLRFPPYAALAEVSGPAAGAFVADLTGRLDLDVVEVVPGSWLVRAPDHDVLGEALASVPRPPGRLRVAVDPPRV